MLIVYINSAMTMKQMCDDMMRQCNDDGTMHNEAIARWYDRDKTMLR